MPLLKIRGMFPFRPARNFFTSVYQCTKSQEKIFDELFSDKPPDIPDEDLVPIKSRKEEQKKVTKKSEKRVPIIECKRSEYNHYKNQMYDKFSTVPLASSGWTHRKSKGDYFTINILPEKSDRESYFWDENVKSFSDLGICENLVDNLQQHGISRPTKIQVDAIPVILAGNCSIVAAETGCGKTLAFLLPIIEQLLELKKSVKDRPPNSPLAVIITPSRELAQQIMDVALKFTSNLMIDSQLLIGGHTKRKMLDPKFEYIDLLVATVGALSKLSSSGLYNLSHVKHVVLDEADTLLDDSFKDYLINLLRKLPFGNRVRSSIPQVVQLTLASATMPKVIPKSLQSLVLGQTFTSIEGNRLHFVPPHVPQTFYRLGLSERPGRLLAIVKQSLARNSPIMVFSNRAPTCDWASMFMNENGIKAINLNGDMPFEIRVGKFKQFQNGEYDVISCTDIGSRGLDTKRVKHVLNYDFPLYMADYIHRCGRVGRVGTSTESFISNFVSGSRDVELVQEIETSVRRFSSLPNVTGNITRIIANRIMRDPSRS